MMLENDIDFNLFLCLPIVGYIKKLVEVNISEVHDNNKRELLECNKLIL